MKKTLKINGSDNLFLRIEINLNKLKLTIINKSASYEKKEIYSEDYLIDIESKIDEIIEEFYIKYNKFNDIEIYWTEELKDSTQIELNIDEDEEVI